MYYTSEEENYRKYGIVILEVYNETLRTIVYHYRKPTPSERNQPISSILTLLFTGVMPLDFTR